MSVKDREVFFIRHIFRYADLFMLKPAGFCLTSLKRIMKKIILLITALPLLMSSAAHALSINIDYRYDHGNFFANQDRRDVLEYAASFYSGFTDALTAITPGWQDTWSARIKNPSPGYDDYAFYTLDNLNIEANALTVFVGAGSAGNFPVLGQASSMAIQSATGSAEFISNLGTRGQGVTTGSGAKDYAPLGGSIWFNSDPGWYFGLNANGLAPGQPDFFTTAIHEISHILGYGIADSWYNLIDDNNLFFGVAAMRVYGQAVPTTGTSHWAEGVMSYYQGQPQEAMMDPSTPYGQRQNPTTLDMAGLADIGWQITPVPLPPALFLFLGGLSVLSCFSRLRKQRTD